VEKNGAYGKDPLFRPPNPRSKGEIGTLQAIDNAIACCEKGCYTSPFHFSESHRLLYYRKELGIPVYAAIGHTGKNEALHSKVNRLTDYVSNIGEELVEKRLMLLVYHHNRQRDIELNKLHDGTPYAWEVRSFHLPPTQHTNPFSA
jgi:hypothetical protein